MPIPGQSKISCKNLTILERSHLSNIFTPMIKGFGNVLTIVVTDEANLMSFHILTFLTKEKFDWKKLFFEVSLLTKKCGIFFIEKLGIFLLGQIIPSKSAVDHTLRVRFDYEKVIFIINKTV